MKLHVNTYKQLLCLQVIDAEGARRGALIVEGIAIGEIFSAIFMSIIV